ncbi:hypothetical protein G4B88_001104 [Cannabis sativa]|uniref:Uncharacterized protein n=1 Tax=Cannabis sativa TaxID=3483 RepID=A0A7J6E0U1_CANSA|nr:hypothetical protein G4B88_001104 [Cannabis sativa]
MWRDLGLKIRKTLLYSLSHLGIKANLLMLQCCPVPDKHDKALRTMLISITTYKLWKTILDGYDNGLKQAPQECVPVEFHQVIDYKNWEAMALAMQFRGIAFLLAKNSRRSMAWVLQCHGMAHHLPTPNCTKEPLIKDMGHCMCIPCRHPHRDLATKKVVRCRKSLKIRDIHIFKCMLQNQRVQHNDNQVGKDSKEHNLYPSIDCLVTTFPSTVPPIENHDP